MGLYAGSDAIVPKFVRAKTPTGLEKAMSDLNRKEGMEYYFYQIFFAEGWFYAWYRRDTSLDPAASKDNLELSEE